MHSRKRNLYQRGKKERKTNKYLFELASPSSLEIEIKMAKGYMPKT
jgi:hypothetical protein